MKTLVTDVRRRIPHSVLELQAIVESTRDEAARAQAIQQLALARTPTACRVLIELYNRTLWRSTRASILSALGVADVQRGTEFLIQVASDAEDLAMAGEAVSALGRTHSPAAGEFLLTLLGNPSGVLRKEVIVALANMPSFFPDDALFQHLKLEREAMPPATEQNTWLALGRLRVFEAWPLLAERLLEVLDEAATRDTPPQVLGACLLAAGELAPAEFLPQLAGANLGRHYFESHLCQMAVEQIRLRAARTIEDAVVLLGAADSTDALCLAARQFRAFSRRDALDALTLLDERATPNHELALRLVHFERSDVGADLQFIARHFSMLSPGPQGALVRRHAGLAEDVVPQLMAQLPLDEARQLLERVSCATSLDWLSSRLLDSSLAPSTRISLVNAMVEQVHMTGCKDAVAAQCADRALALLEQQPPPFLRDRLLRALGQIRCSRRDVNRALEEHGRVDASASASAWAALAMLPVETAAPVLLKRVTHTLNSGSSEAELSALLAALARFGALPETEPLRQLLEKRALSTSRQRQSVLQILSSNALPGQARRVAEGFEGREFIDVMLALAASRLNHNPDVWTQVLGYLDSESLALRGRAIDSLSRGGGPPEHLALVRWLLARPPDARLGLELLRGLHPREGEDYAALLALLSDARATHPLFRIREVDDACDELTSRLHATRATESLRLELGPAAALDHIDARLVGLLPWFTTCTESIKSTLRNAELTFLHPELFGEQVDKSTMMVEYVKAIDLLFEQVLGPQLSGAAGRASGVKLRSRLLTLELDDEVLDPGYWVRALACDSHFSSSDFPAAKLGTLARSILSGKFFNDPFRAIDGLRAWALMLLLFARRFTYRRTAIEPLLETADSSLATVNRVAFLLDSLQRSRNDAAHRGTLLGSAEASEVRDRGLELLRELGGMLLGHNA